MSTVLTALRSGLVVSCQAYPGEPMRSPVIMTAIALAAVEGGALGIRAQGLEDIRSMRAVLDVPLIGLVKVGSDGVFITPTVADSIAVARAGADIVAIDGTGRPRPDGASLAQCVATIHAEGALAMADCGSTQDARASLDAGVDCVGTTLAGYSGARRRTDGPDFDLLAQLMTFSTVPVIAEGRMRTPEDARIALAAGAHAVVVGTAITHPTSITRRFVSALGRRA